MTAILGSYRSRQINRARIKEHSAGGTQDRLMPHLPIREMEVLRAWLSSETHGFGNIS